MADKLKMREKIAGKKRIRVTYGLVLHKGNSRPYFTVTADTWRAEGGYWREDSGGCIHEEVLEHWPDLKPLVDLHLADDNGEPMHGEGNGWYWLAGCTTHGMGERYHGGNRERYGATDDAQMESAKVLASHCRISMAEVLSIVTLCEQELGPEQESHSLSPWKRSDYARARAKWHEIYKAMLPRFEAEAKAAIQQFELEVVHD